MRPASNERLKQPQMHPSFMAAILSAARCPAARRDLAADGGWRDTAGRGSAFSSRAMSSLRWPRSGRPLPPREMAQDGAVEPAVGGQDRPLPEVELPPGVVRHPPARLGDEERAG